MARITPVQNDKANSQSKSHDMSARLGFSFRKSRIVTVSPATAKRNHHGRSHIRASPPVDNKLPLIVNPPAGHLDSDSIRRRFAFHNLRGQAEWLNLKCATLISVKQSMWNPTRRFSSCPVQHLIRPRLDYVAIVSEAPRLIHSALSVSPGLTCGSLLKPRRSPGNRAESHTGNLFVRDGPVNDVPFCLDLPESCVSV